MNKGNTIGRARERGLAAMCMGLCIGAKGKGETRNVEMSVLIKRRGKGT